MRSDGTVGFRDQRKILFFYYPFQPSLYYPVQRGYAQGDSQEYSKGFDRRFRIEKTQNSRLKMTNENLPDTIEANVSSTFVKFTSGSFWMDVEDLEEEDKNDVRVLDWRRVSASQETNVLAWNIRSVFNEEFTFSCTGSLDLVVGERSELF